MNDRQYMRLMDALELVKQLASDRELRIEAMQAQKAIDKLLDKHAENGLRKELVAPY